MDLTPSEDQQAIIDLADRIVADHAGTENDKIAHAITPPGPGR